MVFYQNDVPAIIVTFGLRSVFSMVALTIIVVCLWINERRLDDEGSKLYEVAKGNKTHGDYQSNDAESGTANANDSTKKTAATPDDDKEFGYRPAPDQDKGNGGDGAITMDDYRANKLPESTVQIPPEQLEGVYPPPTYMLGAFGLLTLSFFFHPNGGFYVSFWNVSSAILGMTGGYLVTMPLHDSTIQRDLELKQKAVSGLVVCGVFIAIFCILDVTTGAPWTYCTFGMIFIMTSNGIMWRSRKMGITWDLEGKPNSNITVQNLGPLMLLFGLFLFWVGMNGVDNGDMGSKHLPIYITPRAVMVFVSGCVLIVPSTLALELAFDQGSQTLGYRLDGETFNGLFGDSMPLLATGPFAKAVESPVFYLIGWFLFGLSSFLPFGGTGFTWQKLFSMLICWAIGGVDSALLQPSFWNADAVEHEKYTYLYYCLFAWLAVAIGIQGGAALALCIIGVMFIFAGSKLGMNSRKRGEAWLESRSMNPNPSVYGAGHPIYVMGWILLCISMSIPM